MALMKHFQNCCNKRYLHIWATSSNSTPQIPSGRGLEAKTTDISALVISTDSSREARFLRPKQRLFFVGEVPRDQDFCLDSYIIGIQLNQYNEHKVINK